MDGLDLKKYLECIVTDFKSDKLRINFLFLPRIYSDRGMIIPIDIIQYINKLILEYDKDYHNYILRKWFTGIHCNNICPCIKFECIKKWYIDFMIPFYDWFKHDMDIKHCSIRDCHSIYIDSSGSSCCGGCGKKCCGNCITRIPNDDDDDDRLCIECISKYKPVDNKLKK
jgi:hypothetical protein